LFGAGDLEGFTFPPAALYKQTGRCEVTTAFIAIRHKGKSFGKIKKVNNKNFKKFIIKWQEFVPLPGLIVRWMKPKLLRLFQFPKR
jgi:hypothetical protein